MSNAGWYPDPEGGDQPRYWDGSRWLDGEPRRGNQGLWWFIGGVVLIVVLVVVLVMNPRGLGIAAPAPTDTRSHKPTVEPWDELSSSPDQPGEEEDGGVREEQCPFVGSPRSEVSPDGRLRSGDLSLVAPTAEGWRQSPISMTWMRDQNSMTREVIPGWVASVDVGTVAHEDGFRSPKSAAKNIISCMASSWMFQGFTGSETLLSEPFELDGHQGWYIKENIYVSGREVEGDVLDVYVLDLGNDGELSVIVGCATIDHEPSINEVKASLETMKVG